MVVLVTAVLGVAAIAAILAATPRQPDAPMARATQMSNEPVEGWQRVDLEVLTIDVPDGWHRYDSGAMALGGSSSIAFLGTHPIDGCGVDHADANCVFARPLAPNELRIHVGSSAGFLRRPEIDPTDERRFNAVIDGQPATRHEMVATAGIGADLLIGYSIAMSDQVGGQITVDATIRGPEVDALREEFERIIGSIRLAFHPTPLPDDETVRDRIVATSIEWLDANEREAYGTSYYACFPRDAGASRETLVMGAPGGPLDAPFWGTCSVELTETVLTVWDMTLTATWDAGPGWAAGQYVSHYYIDAAGNGVGVRHEPFDGSFPGS